MKKRKTPKPTSRSRARPLTRPIVIAHRGASGYLPEHTLAAYAVAMLQGADFIEPDLVMTQDGHLIARHDNVLNLTTDVAQRQEFAARRTDKIVDGVATNGWFSEDFTLAEIKQLRAVERIPDVRPANTRLNGQFQVPTLQEIIDLVNANERALDRKIGIYLETKHPTYFQRLGLTLEGKLVKILHASGYATKRDRVFIQSFEISNLFATVQSSLREAVHEFPDFFRKDDSRGIAPHAFKVLGIRKPESQPFFLKLAFEFLL